MLEAVSFKSNRLLWNLGFKGRKERNIIINMKYYKSDLIDLISEKTGFYKMDIEEVVDCIIYEIPKMLNKEGDELLLKNLGKFMCKLRKGRMFKRPTDGVEIEIPDGLLLKFKASEGMYDEKQKNNG